MVISEIRCDVFPSILRSRFSLFWLHPCKIVESEISPEDEKAQAVVLRLYLKLDSPFLSTESTFFYFCCGAVANSPTPAKRKSKRICPTAQKVEQKKPVFITYIYTSPFPFSASSIPFTDDTTFHRLKNALTV